DLVANSAGRVLVSGRLGEPVEVHRLAAGDHREGEVADLPTLHAVDEDRHGHRGHLLVADVAARVGVDEPVHLLGRQGAAVALGVDEVDNVERFDGHGYSLSGDAEKMNDGKRGGNADVSEKSPRWGAER